MKYSLTLLLMIGSVVLPTLAQERLPYLQAKRQQQETFGTNERIFVLRDDKTPAPVQERIQWYNGQQWQTFQPPQVYLQPMYVQPPRPRFADLAAMGLVTDIPAYNAKIRADNDREALKAELRAELLAEPVQVAMTTTAAAILLPGSTPVPQQRVTLDLSEDVDTAEMVLQGATNEEQKTLLEFSTRAQDSRSGRQDDTYEYKARRLGYLLALAAIGVAAVALVVPWGFKIIITELSKGKQLL